MCVHIYIYVCVYTHIYICICMYVYIYGEREREILICTHVKGLEARLTTSAPYIPSRFLD